MRVSMNGSSQLCKYGLAVEVSDGSLGINGLSDSWFT
jgi:hypothetical protein